MTVAEMPSDAHERVLVRGTNFEQLFWLGNDTDDAAFRETESISIAQMMRLGEINQELRSGNRGKDKPAAMAAVEIDPYPIDFLFGIPGAGRSHAECTHAQKRK